MQSLLRPLINLRLVMSNGRLLILRNHLSASLVCQTSQPVISQLSSRNCGTQSHTDAVKNVFSVVDSLTANNSGRVAENNSPSTLIAGYRGLSLEDKADFLTKLSTDYKSNNESLTSSIKAIQLSEDASISQRQLQRLRASLLTRYEQLFRHIGSAVGGVKFLVDLRKDLIGITRQCLVPDQLSTLQTMNSNLKEVSKPKFHMILVKHIICGKLVNSSLYS